MGACCGEEEQGNSKMDTKGKNRNKKGDKSKDKKSKDKKKRK